MIMNCEKFISLANDIKNDVCIFGAGDYGRTWCYALLNDAGFKVSYYVDNNKAGGECNELPVHSVDYLKEHPDDYVFISARGTAEDEIAKQLESIGIDSYYRFESDYAPIDLAHYLDGLGDKELIKAFPSIMDDEAYLKIRFKYRMGYDLNLDKPRTFNEKLNWLKIHDRKSIYTIMADKLAVKDYVSKKIGCEHVVPLFDVWERYEDIDFRSLPNQFVLKCSHNCGDIVICKNKNDYNYAFAKRQFDKALKRNAFWPDREWPYKEVRPLIIAEKFIESNDAVLVVYKFFCFDGEPFIVQVVNNDKMPNESIDYYDLNWQLLEVRQNYPNSKTHVDKPKKLSEMIEICKILSYGMSFVRVDLYLDKNDWIYFSEYTFYSDSGSERFYPNKWDLILGDRLDIKLVK